MSVETKLDVLTAAVQELTRTMKVMIDLQKEITQKGRRVRRTLTDKEKNISKSEPEKLAETPRIKRLRAQLSPEAIDKQIDETIRGSLRKIGDKDKRTMYIGDIFKFTLENSDYEKEEDVKLIGNESKLTSSQKISVLEYAKERVDNYIDKTLL